MLRNRVYSLVLLFCGILIMSLSIGASLAQEELPLRDLAAKKGFYIGAAVYTTHLNDPLHVETLSREFNMLTPENEAKACETQPQQGKFTFDGFDRLVDFAEEHDMVVHGHTLVWHQCSPVWLDTGTFTRDEAIELLENHIKTVVGRYKGRVPIWDVVNEAVDDNGQSLRDTPWHRLIGDDYIDLAFQFAHEADPDARLFYNDYGTEGLNAKSNTVYNLVADMIERGVPIHGVGLQAHFELGGFNAEQIAANIKRLGELGLEVQITELDVRYAGEATEETFLRQAGDYRRVLDVCLSSEYCTAFITWGVTDKFTWLRNSNLGFYSNPTVEPLLFDDEYQPKPAYMAVADLLARHAGEEPLLSDEEVEAMLSGTTVAAEVEIPEPTKSDPAQLAPDSAAGAVYYAAFPVTITLDGETDDWANIPRVTVDTGPTLPANNDTTLVFAAAADDENLYFLAEVTDSTIVAGVRDAASEWYLEDSVELYINASGDLKAGSYVPGIAQIAILAANIDNDSPDTPIIGGSGSADSQVRVMAVKTETGYRIEASVPLVTDVWTIAPEHLGALGFQAHLNGSSGEDRDTKLIWSVYDTQDQSWNNPGLFGQLIFWDVTQ